MPLIMTTLFVGIIFYTVMVKLGEILGLSADVSPGQIGAIGAGANVGVAVGTVLFRRFKGASGPMLVFDRTDIGKHRLSWGQSFRIAHGIAASVIVASIGFGMLLPTMLTWLLQLLPMGVRGRGAGLWTGIFFFGQFFAPILAAALQNNLGGLANVLILYAGLCAIGVVIAATRLKGAADLLTK